MAFVGSSGALRKADVAYVAVRVLPHNLAHRRVAKIAHCVDLIAQGLRELEEALQKLNVALTNGQGRKTGTPQANTPANETQSA